MTNKSIKKVKFWAKLKQKLIRIGLNILPFVPIVACFALINFLLGSRFEHAMIKILAMIGVLTICLVMWWITNTLIMITDHKIKSRQATKESEVEIYD